MSTPENAHVRGVGPSEASSLSHQGAVLLDVREDHEWDEIRIEGAVHVPLGDLDATALPVDVPSNLPIIAVCRSGNRSSKAAVALAAAGHEVVNLEGGMNGWVDADLPVVSGPTESRTS